MSASDRDRWNTVALTWLNGRCAPITIYHEKELVIFWDPTWGISIEDAILQFSEKHGIDLAKEAGC